MQFLCGGGDDYTLSVRFPYDLRNVSVRFVPVCHRNKTQGDRKQCKHVACSHLRCLKNHKENLRQINCKMIVANVTEALDLALKREQMTIVVSNRKRFIRIFALPFISAVSKTE